MGEDDDLLPEPEIIHRPATAHGWVRRSDIGPGVWEKPDGKLYTAPHDEWEPTILSFTMPPIWEKRSG